MNVQGKPGPIVERGGLSPRSGYKDLFQVYWYKVRGLREEKPGNEEMRMISKHIVSKVNQIFTIFLVQGPVSQRAGNFIWLISQDLSVLVFAKISRFAFVIREYAHS